MLVLSNSSVPDPALMLSMVALRVGDPVVPVWQEWGEKNLGGILESLDWSKVSTYFTPFSTKSFYETVIALSYGPLNTGWSLFHLPWFRRNVKSPFLKTMSTPNSGKGTFLSVSSLISAKTQSMPLRMAFNGVVETVVGFDVFVVMTFLSSRSVASYSVTSSISSSIWENKICEARA